MAQPGDKKGKYTIVRHLGEGGMGSVYEAVYVDTNTGFEQRVAIKEADPEIIDTEEGRDLFYREAMLPSSLRHPNIATVLEVNAEDGFLVYELVDGATMADVLRVAGNRFTIPLSIFLISQICRALAYAHNRVLHGKLSPVVHRDLSPQNVMIDYDGNVKIVDWGIAKATTSREKSRTIKGKLAYMSPEQASGGEIDGRTDIYALGAMAYEMISGLRPNDADTDARTLHILLSGTHVPIVDQMPEIPAGIGKIIEQMIALRPENRFPNMESVLDALAPFAPPYTIYRDLAALVRKAHPPQTIVLEQGRFVSRLVADSPEVSNPQMTARSIISNSSGRLNVPATETFEYHQARLNESAANAATAIDTDSLERPAPSVSSISTIDEAEMILRRSRSLNMGIIAVGIVAAVAMVGLISWKMTTRPVVAETSIITTSPVPKPKPTPEPEKAYPTEEFATREVVENNTPNTTVTKADIESAEVVESSEPVPAVVRSLPSTSAEKTPRPVVDKPSDSAAKGGSRTRKTRPSASVSEKKAPRSISSEAAAETKQIYVDVTPSSRSYTVWVDGEKKGRTPITLKLSKGNYAIAVGLKEPAYAKRINVDDQMNRRIIFNLDDELFKLDDF